MQYIEKTVKKFKEDFHKIPRRDQFLICLVLLLCFILGISYPSLSRKISSIGVKNKLILKVTPTVIPLPAALTLYADPPEVKKGSTLTVDILIDSPNQGVEAADFVINYDTDIFKVASISAGNYFGQYPINSIGDGFVKLSGVASLENNTLKIPKGRGTVGTLHVTAKKSARNSKISFDKDKTIVATNGKNIMGEVKDLEITVK